MMRFIRFSTLLLAVVLFSSCSQKCRPQRAVSPDKTLYEADEVLQKSSSRPAFSNLINGIPTANTPRRLPGYSQFYKKWDRELVARNQYKLHHLLSNHEMADDAS
jgi:hypothetical protein